MRRLGIAIRAAVALALFALGGGACVLLLYLLQDLPAGSRPLPSFLEVRETRRSSEGILLDRRGEPLQEVRADFSGRRLDWVPLGEVSPALVAAVLRSEDKRFSRHHGVDGIALISAAWESVCRQRPRGASTITMQLASLLSGKGRDRGTAAAIAAKLRQMRSALRLERSWTKGELLEAYLNLVPFRGELRGIAAASRGMFDKEPGGLDAAESALLAALIRAPGAPPGAVARRAVRLCAALGADVAPEALDALARARLHAPFSVRPRHDLAAHAARILSPGPGERVVSTLDAGLQRFAAEAMAQRLAALSGRNVRDGAVLVAENATGEILAYVGSAGPASRNRHVDGIRARRQAGSTLKPFLYGTALERRVLTAASLLDDSPLDVPTERGLYAPRNYDGEFRGLVTVRESLAASLNVPAVRTVLLVGPGAMARRLAGFGFDLPDAEEEFGASLALGSADVTLLELVNAYRALANGGRWSPLVLRPGEGRGNGRRAMGRGAAFIVSDILSDRGARGAAFGLESPLSTPFWTAVKTGTSKDMRDNWCVGFSGRFTVGVWVGNFSGEPMWNVSGITGAAPAWMDVMLFLHGDRSGRPPAPPPGVAARRVVFPDSPGAERVELFLAGTEPAGPAVTRAAERPPKIRYPAEGTIVALDPDIPEDRQLLFFEADGSGDGAAWVLDGKKIGPADAPLPWRPMEGAHVLALVARKGAARGDEPPGGAVREEPAVDAVRFSVRGGSGGASVPEAHPTGAGK